MAIAVILVVNSQHVHQINHVVTAIAYIVTMNHAIITTGAAAKSPDGAKRNAAVGFLENTKYSVAVMFHSTTVKHAADMSPNTIALTIVSHARNGFAIVSADMYHATIISVYVTQLAATKVATPVATQVATQVAVTAAAEAIMAVTCTTTINNPSSLTMAYYCGWVT